ncbi:MAG: glycosyltransferase, partial [Bacteroidales bacterium]|nr:glycosyltransferase [Bacteroidales bacterium]
VCVFSEYQQEKYRAIYKKNCYTLGMSCKDFGPSSLQPRDLADGCDLLFFGGIMRYKGLDLLIEGLEKLYGQGIRNLRLTIAGDGEDRDACKALIRTPELYRLQMRFIDNSEIADLMCSHHFLVLPYRDVTQSGPLMIAANYGLPVMAPAMGSFTELYDDNSAILYDSLEDALMKAAALSEQDYARMRESAARLHERCSQQIVAHRYIDYFNTLLEA